MSQQHLQCSWVWAGTSGHAPSRETGPLSHPRPVAPRCCTTSPGSACAFAPRGCGWCSAPRPGTATPSPSGRQGRHLHAQHAQKWWIYAFESVFYPVRMYTFKLLSLVWSVLSLYAGYFGFLSHITCRYGDHAQVCHITLPVRVPLLSSNVLVSSPAGSRWGDACRVVCLLGLTKHLLWLPLPNIAQRCGSLGVTDVQRIISVTAINHCSKINLYPVEAWVWGRPNVWLLVVYWSLT